MVERTDQAGKTHALAATYLEGVRAAIPLPLAQVRKQREVRVCK
jgi:hypothetical protein